MQFCCDFAIGVPVRGYGIARPGDHPRRSGVPKYPAMHSAFGELVLGGIWHRRPSPQLRSDGRHRNKFKSIVADTFVAYQWAGAVAEAWEKVWVLWQVCPYRLQRCSGAGERPARCGRRSGADEARSAVLPTSRIDPRSCWTAYGAAPLPYVQLKLQRLWPRRHRERKTLAHRYRRHVPSFLVAVGWPTYWLSNGPCHELRRSPLEQVGCTIRMMQATGQMCWCTVRRRGELPRLWRLREWVVA